MNNNTDSSESLNKLKLAEEFTDHPIMIWVNDNRKNLLMIFLATLIVLIVAYRIIANQHSNSEAAYLEAQADFLRFQDLTLASVEPAIRDEAFNKLDAIIHRYPNLHLKYDGLIAQTLIIDKKIVDAKKFGMTAFERVSKETSPHYLDFAKITLAIEEGLYPDALQQSKELKERMVAEAERASDDSIKLTFGSTLYLFNLIRIAMLSEQLGNKVEETNAWENLLQLATGNAPLSKIIDTSEVQATLAIFTEGKATLWKYIADRKK